MEQAQGVTKADNKVDVLELARAHGLFGPPAGGVQAEGTSIEKTDYWTAVDSYLHCVQDQITEPVDIGSEAMLRRLRNKKKFIQEYKKTMGNADSVEEGSDDESAAAAEEEEDEQQQQEKTARAAEAIPIPAVSPETEKLLRCSRTLHQQTAGLRSFLKDLLSEEEEEEEELRGDGEGLQSCPNLEESSVVSQILSRDKIIAERREELKELEEYPNAVLPDNVKSSLDRCMQMLSVGEADDRHSSDLLPSEYEK